MSLFPKMLRDASMDVFFSRVSDIRVFDMATKERRYE